MEIPNAHVNSNDRLNLKKLIDDMGVDEKDLDNTQHIRKVKHSVPLAQDIKTIERLKQQNTTLKNSHSEQFIELCQSQCPFLYNNYTDIFHKLLKDELDLEIMQKVLYVLNMIEDGKVDQHEGSVIVGKILKELYLDSAVRRGENLDKEYPPVQKNEGKKLTWTEYKRITEKNYLPENDVYL